MSSNFFAMVNRMKLIDRWALMNNSTKENIAEHSHSVAVIAHALALIGNKKFGKSYNAELENMNKEKKVLKIRQL